MEEYVKKSDVLDLLSLPTDILAEYIHELKGVWFDEDYNGEWILCEERFPEKAGEYLITGAWKGEPAKIWICECLVFGGMSGWANNARNPIVNAWMPLPEPYKSN